MSRMFLSITGGYKVDPNNTNTRFYDLLQALEVLDHPPMWVVIRTSVRSRRLIALKGLHIC